MYQDWRAVASKHFDTQSSDDNESLLKVLLEMSRLATAMPVVLECDPCRSFSRHTQLCIKCIESNYWKVRICVVLSSEFACSI